VAIAQSHCHWAKTKTKHRAKERERERGESWEEKVAVDSRANIHRIKGCHRKPEAINSKPQTLNPDPLISES
jgi:hypothetical protein